MVSLTVLPLRVTLRAEGDLVVANPSTALRGAFGMALRRTACAAECSAALSCPRGEGTCFYNRFFNGALSPEARAAAPSGYRENAPKPFVLRSSLARGLTPRGSVWTLDLYYFDPPGAPVGALRAALAQLAGAGLGQARVRSEIVAVEGVNRFFEAQPALQTHCLPLPLPQASEPERFRVSFRTPTEIVSAGRVAALPEFRLFIQALGHRMQALCRFYGDGRWAPGEMTDFLAYAEGASTKIVQASHPLRFRTSTRTGQTHPLTGFKGVVEYLGRWRSYLPWLEAGLWTGAGKHTQFGHGQYSFDAGASARPVPFNDVDGHSESGQPYD